MPSGVITTERSCAQCGALFQGRRYCSDACSRKARNARKYAAKRAKKPRSQNRPEGFEQGSVYATMSHEQQAAFRRWMDEKNADARAYEYGLRKLVAA